MSEGKINGCVRRGPTDRPIFHCAMCRELQPNCIGYEGPPPRRCARQRVASAPFGTYACCTEPMCRAQATHEYKEPQELPEQFVSRYPATPDESFKPLSAEQREELKARGCAIVEGPPPGVATVACLTSLPCMTDGSPAYTTNPVMRKED